MIKPKMYVGTVIDIDILTPNVKKYYISLNENFSFIPGQFVNVEVAKGKYRSYSLANKKVETRCVELIVSLKGDGIGVNFFKNLQKDQSIKFIGPSGKFKLKNPAEKYLYFFSTGVGIVPFIPMFQNLIDNGYQGNITLYQGVRHIEDIFLIDFLNEVSNKINIFSYKIFVSQPEKPTPPEYTSGRITLDKNFENILKDSNFYICGNPNMVFEVKNKIETLGVDNSAIFTEKY